LSKAKLTPQQLRFCEEYIVDLNGSEAAVRAEYSRKSSRSIASELLAKPQIQEKISELKAERSKRVEVTADDVLKTLKTAVDLDIFQLLNAKGEWKPLKDIPPEIRKLITSVEFDPYDPGKITNIRFLPKTFSTSLLAKHTGIEKNNLNVGGDESLIDLLAAAARLNDEAKPGG
jgi:phage terminase small subunit